MFRDGPYDDAEALFLVNVLVVRLLPPSARAGTYRFCPDGPLNMRPTGARGSRRYEVKGVVNTGPMFTTDGVPKGIRTPVSEVKIRGPGPLDDGDQSKVPYVPAPDSPVKNLVRSG